MTKYGPLGLYAGLVLCVVYILCDSGSRTQAQSFAKLEGSLFHADIPEISKADTPLPRQETYLTHLPIYVDHVAGLGLPANANAFIGDISADPHSPLKILVAAPESKTSGSKPAAADKSARRHSKAAPGHPAIVGSSQTAATPVKSPAVPPDTFLTLDAKLSQNPMSFPVENRIKKGDIMIALEQLGKFEGYYLLKFSVANNEPDEFFISKVMMFTSAHPVSSNEFMPFSCRSGEVIYGIVRFTINDVANKRVGFALTESGGKERKYEIRSINFAF